MILFALTATHDWDIGQMDVVTAFLHPTIKEDVYMEIPEGYGQRDNDDYRRNEPKRDNVDCRRDEMKRDNEDYQRKRDNADCRRDELKRDNVDCRRDEHIKRDNVDCRRTHVCKLNKALYGLKQAPRA